MISNVDTFLAVAREAHDEMKRAIDEGRRPKPDGSPGYIITLDPERRSFKQALIATTFAGIYFEALTYFVARRVSKSKAERVDKAGYRGKLEELKVTDELILQAAEMFRQDRNELVHERALPASEMNLMEVRHAQVCADKAMEFIASVREVLADAR